MLNNKIDLLLTNLESKKLLFQKKYTVLFLFCFSVLLINCKNKEHNNNVIEQLKNEVQIENKSLKYITKKFIPTAIGNKFEEPPQISNLTVGDVNQDDLLDVVVCDIKNNTISIISQNPKDTFTEKIVADSIKAPAHVQIFDFDSDGDKDLIVALLGMLFPNNDRIGSIIVLENDGRNNFYKRVVIENISRVADVRAGDIDGDGDIDLVTAQFGYDDGETSWIENLGNWTFKNHSLQNLSGPINVELIDIDFDNDLDIISLVTQEWEKIYCFENDGKGNFKPKQLWGASNEDYGSSGISITDINKDGKPDILYTNGDAFDYLPPLPRPWHGVQWLENLGGIKFKHHHITNFPGAFSARATDVDKDNDEDIFVVSGFNYWDKPTAESIILLENDGNNTFNKHTIAKSPTHLITLELADFNKDGHMDMVTGGVYIYPPYDKLERVTLWMNAGN
ncbi:FG-GAP repeat domain-containing protein [Seonamhaeicola maritimus]|uniref:VCBS repeat-containing protein n=1 Tax=Seonamhaeicola maritimus TaxID=2591822 RepID=A0A5C7GLY2_9FLAO|nr:VCBS repeat-containing protein [Seonamhaeicola maritimus]TXG39516.1 VCBS repeat-containing protein [Seonamhaeicola maritimus]